MALNNTFRHDEVTYISEFKLSCPNCGDSNMIYDKDQPAFTISPIVLIVPLVCNTCKYCLSINSILGEL